MLTGTVPIVFVLPGRFAGRIAPELSGRLRNLYLYMQQRLLDANMQQVDPPLAEVLGLLITLEEAWSGVAAQLAQNRDAQTGVEEVRETEDGEWRHAVQGSSAYGREDVRRIAVHA